MKYGPTLSFGSVNPMYGTASMLAISLLNGATFLGSLSPNDRFHREEEEEERMEFLMAP